MKNRLIILFILIFSAPCAAFAGEYAGGVTSTVILTATTTTDGKPAQYLKTDKPEITAVRVEIAPGAETGWHSHPVPLYAYIVSGELSVEAEGGKVYEFKAGDALVEMVNTFHNGWNRGKTPVVLIGFYTGEAGKPKVIKKP